MAINPSAKYPGRVSTPDTDYPYGGAKNSTTPGNGTGTPREKDIVNDVLGFQQAILRVAGLTPSGTSDTATLSQYLQGIIQQAMGRAGYCDDTGAADAYVLELKANQQGPGVVFEGMRVVFTPGNDNTGASTVDISDLLGEAPGTTLVDVKLKGGTEDPAAGHLSSSDEAELVYRTSPGVHFELIITQSRVYDATGFPDLVQTNGDIQLFTATSSPTFTLDMTSGAALLLILSGADTYPPTWPTIDWGVVGEPSAYSSKDQFEFLKVGSTIYGYKIWSAA